MAQVVPLRVNDSWVNLVGELANPRYVFITDKIAKNLVPNFSSININARDLVVEVKKGTLDNVKAFFKLRKKDFTKVEAFVFLWVGMDDLALDDSSLPSPVSAAVAEYFHPDGPNIFPHLSVSEVVTKYHELVVAMATLFPTASIFSSDPAPRRSTGFAIYRADKVMKGIEKQFDAHHHIALNHKFHGRRRSNEVDNSGGRLPLFDHLFDDGVFPKVESWVLIFERVYAAIAILGKSASSQQMGLLRDIKIMF